MNTANRIELEGTVHGAAWTSYGHGQRGRVNFWLAVSRELAGDGFDLLLCAVEMRTGNELLRLDAELRDGRTVRVCAKAHSMVNPSGALLVQLPAVIFIAEECGFDGEAPRNAHSVGLRRHAHHGKAAAAADTETAEADELFHLAGR